MKRQTLALLAALLTLGLHAGAQPDTVRLRAMTFNLRFGELASLEQLAGVIRSERPDVVAIQEADCKTAREGVAHQHGRDFLSELGYRTGLMPLYGKTIGHAGGLYGIGILTAWPYTEVRKVMLPRTRPDEEQRALLLATLENGRGDTVVFACTHLDYATEKSRRLQLEAIARELADCRYPVLLGGDFNAAADAAEIREAEQRWKRLCGTEPTFPASDPDTRLDYLFGYPGARWEADSTRAIPGTASDHLPVVSAVRLVPENASRVAPPDRQ